jgi:hypothetical protein
MKTRIKAESPDPFPVQGRDDSFALLTQEIENLHKDLLAFQARTECRFDKMDARLDRMGGWLAKNGPLDRIERELRGLRADIPKIVRSAMRDALRTKPHGSS